MIWVHKQYTEPVILTISLENIKELITRLLYGMSIFIIKRV